MSNAIAQSTSQVAISPAGEDSYPFADRLKSIMERTVKGTTRERQMLNVSKLTSALCADYRAHFPAIYGKTERLPSEVFEKIQTEVTTAVNEQLNRVHAGNAISFRRGFHHNAKEMEITERVVNTGENKLTFREQLLGVDLFIGAAERRLKDLEAKKTPDYDREKEIKQQIMRLNLTKQCILGEIKHQEKLVSETKPS